MNISRFLLYCVFNDSSPAGLCRYQIKDALSPCLYPVYGVYGDQDRQQDCSVFRRPPARAQCSVLVPRFVLCFVRTVTGTCSHCSAAHHRWPCPGCPSSHQPRVLSIVPSSGSDTQSFVLSSHHLHSVPHENISAICIMKWLLMLTNCIAKLNCSVTVNYSVTLHNFDSMYTPTTHFAVWM